MKQTVDLYICSKPLQYFNIKNIGEVENTGEKKILVVVADFLDANTFVDNIKKYDDDWDEVIFLHNRREREIFLAKQNVNNLFIENDSSWIMLCIYLRGRIKNLFVFEEGVGTYKNIPYSPWIKSIRKLAGIGIHYGASWFCKGVFLYESELYKKRFHSKKAIPFKCSFLEGLKANESLFAKLSPALPSYLNVQNKTILIYITNHEIDYNLIRKMETQADNYDLVFIKLHPHITNFNLKSDKIRVVTTNMMMELILHYLLQNNNKLDVWHYASTAMIHFIDKVKETNLSTNFPIYDEFVAYIKKKKLTYV